MPTVKVHTALCNRANTGRNHRFRVNLAFSLVRAMTSAGDRVAHPRPHSGQRAGETRTGRAPVMESREPGRQRG